MYAIFRALGKQFRAEKGQTLRVPLMAEEPGAKVTFGEVLLASDGDTVRAGQPLLKGAAVEAEVVGHVKDRKITIFKFKRRKNYRRRTGHRSLSTKIRISSIAG